MCGNVTLQLTGLGLLLIYLGECLLMGNQPASDVPGRRLQVVASRGFSAKLLWLIARTSGQCGTSALDSLFENAIR